MAIEIFSVGIEIPGVWTQKICLPFDTYTTRSIPLTVTKRLHLLAGSKSKVHLRRKRPSHDLRKVTNSTSAFSEIVVSGARKSKVSYFA